MGQTLRNLPERGSGREARESLFTFPGSTAEREYGEGFRSASRERAAVPQGREGASPR